MMCASEIIGAIRLVLLFLIALAGGPSAACRSQTIIATVNGTITNGALGFAVASTGDLNGDGIREALVSAPGVSSSAGFSTAGLGPGSVFVVSKSATGSLTVLRTHSGNTYNSRFGFCCLSAGDIDGDGLDDYMVGAPGEVVPPSTAGSGTVRVFSGATGAQIYLLAASGSTQFGTKFGTSIGAGDLDFNGTSDILVGDPESSGSIPEQAVAYSGVNGSVLTTATTCVLPLSTYQMDYGAGVAVLDDINGDGRREFAVTAVSRNAVCVHDGMSAAVLSSYQIPGILTLSYGAGFGVSIVSVPDANGDGFRDLAIGAPYAASPTATISSGRIWIVSSVAAAVLRTIDGDPGDRLGWSLLQISDIDGDGVEDLAAGAPQISIDGLPSGTFLPFSAPVGPGKVRIFSGTTGESIESIDGPSFGAAFGFSISSAGDSNGDGVPELLVGAPWDDAGGTDVGALSWVSLEPLHSLLAAGSVGSTNGGPFPMLFLDGSTGGADRTVDLSIAQAFQIDVGQPNLGVPAPFAVWGYLGRPTLSDLVPSTSGTFLFAPAPLLPSSPIHFSMTNNIWMEPGTLTGSTAGPWTRIVPSGIPFPIEFTLQGIIADATQSPIPFGITNALSVQVQ